MSRPVIARLGLVALTAAGWLVGCAGGGLPATHYYTLATPAERAPAETARSGAAIGIRSFAVDPPYDQDRLVFRESEGTAEIGFYNYHRWASPLGRLLPVALSEVLRDTAGIASAEPARAAGDYDAMLDGRLIYLEEVGVAGGQEARVALELELTDREGEIVWSGNLAGSASGRATEVSEVVGLVRRALDDVLGRAAREVGEALAGRGATAAD